MADLGRLLDRYAVYLQNKGDSAKHVHDTRFRVQRVMGFAEISTLKALTPERVMSAAAILKGNGLAAESVAHHLRAVRAFGRFLWVHRHLPRPLALCIKVNQHEKTHQRRILTDGEIDQLLQSTEVSEPCRGMSGHARAMLYELAINTGLRSGELRSLRVGDFNVLRKLINVSSAYTKNRKPATIHLPDNTAERLATFVLDRSSNEPLFTMPRPETIVLMLRSDLKRCAIPYELGGRVVDFHALRHTFITRCAKAVCDVRLVQQLARHSTVQLTLGTYTHTQDSELVDAVRSLPAIVRDQMGRAGIEPATHGFSVHYEPKTHDLTGSTWAGNVFTAGGHS